MKKIALPLEHGFVKISRKIFSAVIALILLATSFLIFASSLGLPQGIKLYSVLTGSMEPALPVGSLIITRNPTQINPGDIITFTEPSTRDKYITHRVEDIKEENGQITYITKGDANPSPDPWNILPDRIQGAYKTHIPYAGTILQYIKSPIGIILFIIIPTLFITVLEIKNILSVLLEKKIRRLEKIKQEIAIMRRAYKPPYHSHRLDSVKQTESLSSSRIIKKVTVVPLIIYLLITTGYIKIGATYSFFNSNTVTIAGATLTVADKFDKEIISNYCDLSVDSKLMNNNTGENSTNTNELNVSQECNINIENDTNVSNDININVDTGNNSSNDNTDSGNINTGNVNISIGI